MVSVTAALLINLLHLDTDFDDETMENLIDQSIDIINLYGNLELPNMNGTAGSKTVSLTSAQKGAVVMVARTVYSEFYENDDGSINVGGLAIASTALFANTQIMSSVRKAARLLYKRENTMEVDVG